MSRRGGTIQTDPPPQPQIHPEAGGYNTPGVAPLQAHLPDDRYLSRQEAAISEGNAAKRGHPDRAQVRSQTLFQNLKSKCWTLLQQVCVDFKPEQAQKNTVNEELFGFAPPRGNFFFFPFKHEPEVFIASDHTASVVPTRLKEAVILNDKEH